MNVTLAVGEKFLCLDFRIYSFDVTWNKESKFIRVYIINIGCLRRNLPYFENFLYFKLHGT